MNDVTVVTSVTYPSPESRWLWWLMCNTTNHICQPLKTEIQGLLTQDFMLVFLP